MHTASLCSRNGRSRYGDHRSTPSAAEQDCVHVTRGQRGDGSGDLGRTWESLPRCRDRSLSWNSHVWDTPQGSTLRKQPTESSHCPHQNPTSRPRAAWRRRHQSGPDDSENTDPASRLPGGTSGRNRRATGNQYDEEAGPSGEKGHPGLNAGDGRQGTRGRAEKTEPRTARHTTCSPTRITDGTVKPMGGAGGTVGSGRGPGVLGRSPMSGSLLSAHTFSYSLIKKTFKKLRNTKPQKF